MKGKMRNKKNNTWKIVCNYWDSIYLWVLDGCRTY